MPVVESYLVPGKAIKLKLYYQKYLTDTITYGYPITGMKINISNGSSSITLTESSSTPGTYLYTDTNFVKKGLSYTMSFDYNGSTVTAKTTVPDKPTGFVGSATREYLPSMTSSTTFHPVVYSWNNTNSWNYILVFQNVDSPKVAADFGTTIAYKDIENRIGVVSSYSTDRRMFNYIGNYHVILFHINQEYADAINSSSSTSLNLTNQGTNVVNGLGIFTALMPSDTLKLYVYQ